MWLISHPHDVSSEELNGYDHVFVASSAYAARLAQRTSSPVEELLQCTDPELFYPEKSSNSTSDQVLFVGNTRGVYREVVRAAIEQGLEIDIYGAFWDKFISGDCYKGSWIPYDKLREYYCRCGVLLNDHWDDMREEGFISNRVFDAAACGALVVSDHVKGIEEVFGGAIHTYVESAQLKDKVESALRSRHETEVQRLELADKVSKLHSFDKRAERIMMVVRDLLRVRTQKNTENIRSIRH
jgi:glycosyltransferase involved in cell wall biosynthesis